MIRRLTAEERELWEKLRRSVRPLVADREEAPPPPLAQVDAAASGQPAAPTLLPPARPSEPPLVGVEDRLRRRLARGLADVDARIDLHGMRQERAFTVLLAFLRHAQLRGSKLVLVITGKGRDGEPGGRGVLRQAVPAWLSRPDLRDLIAGFEEAGRRHGGAGALYVRLRRRKPARRAGDPG